MFEWGSRTYIFGVLNVTPDSFSGDGVMDASMALSHALAMRAEGADVIDVGGESTRPGHTPVQAVLMDDRDVRGADDPVGLVRDHLAALVERAARGGIARERVIVDPGFGFGKTRRENFILLRELARLRELGRPILVGTSRKSSIGGALGGLPPEERVEGTAATVAIAIANGADAVRVHDVREMARVARTADAIVRASAG